MKSESSYSSDTECFEHRVCIQKGSSKQKVVHTLNKATVKEPLHSDKTGNIVTEEQTTNLRPKRLLISSPVTSQGFADNGQICALSLEIEEPNEVQPALI